MTDIVERLRKDAEATRASIAHMKANDTGWFDTMPPEVLTDMEHDAELSETAADEIERLRSLAPVTEAVQTIISIYQWGYGDDASARREYDRVARTLLALEEVDGSRRA